MAEADDLETGLKDRFLNAAEFLRKKGSQLDSSKLLELYGYYKQATEGECTIPRPSWYQIIEKEKWDAWKNLKSMNKDDAMRFYIQLVNEIYPGWEDVERDSESGNNWVSVSSMVNEDDKLSDLDKTFVDWVKEGNKLKVKQCSGDIDINDLDAEGLGAVHWAADRGNLDILKYLITELNADIELTDQDGQTPLHYAVSCGHIDTVKFLIENGANVNAQDSEGSTPKDMACDEKILELLK